MGLINQEGFFRGHIVDAGLSQSTNGFPQEVMALKAEEMYDPDTQEFLPVDAEHDEIMTYQILIDSKDKETKGSQQVKKITGWDGTDFTTLVENDYADVPLTFRVEENEWNENTTLQVSWIDVPDAPPTRTVSKISKEDAAALQARYASTLSKNKVAVKPKKVTAKVVEEKVTKAEKPAATKPTASRPMKPAAVVGKCSAEDAYNECFALSGAVEGEPSGEALNAVWLAEEAKAAKKYGGDEKQVTEEEWFVVKEAIVKQTSKV